MSDFIELVIEIIGAAIEITLEPRSGKKTKLRKNVEAIIVLIIFILLMVGIFVIAIRASMVWLKIVAIITIVLLGSFMVGRVYRIVKKDR